MNRIYIEDIEIDFIRFAPIVIAGGFRVKYKEYSIPFEGLPPELQKQLKEFVKANISFGRRTTNLLLASQPVSPTLRERFLRDLQRRCHESFSDPHEEVYRHGVWTGILNALDVNSPHAVLTLREAAFWHREGVQYLWNLKRAQGCDHVPDDWDGDGMAHCAWCGRWYSKYEGDS